MQKRIKAKEVNHVDLKFVCKVGVTSVSLK